MTTIAFSTDIQAKIFEEEIKGQISDGLWENTYGSDWQTWCRATPVVNPANVGRDFFARKDNFRLTALVPFIGERMVEIGRTIDPAYTEARLLQDLRAISKAMKTSIR